MRKLMMTTFLLVFILSGCIPNVGQQEEVVQENETNEETAIVPKYQISDSYYRTLTPFKPSGSRGTVLTNLDNNRFESDEMEEGLFRIAQRNFSTDSYIFQEGQYLDDEIVKKWLSRKQSESDPNGLNPYLGPERTRENYEANPVYLSHILEHNYLIRADENTVKLGGVVIGLALKSVYYYRIIDDEGLHYNYELQISDEELETEGKKIAENVINRLRLMEGLEEVPITIALYKQESRTSAIPGNFFAYATAKTGNRLDWNSVNEKNVLFPSNDAVQNHLDDANQFERFKTAVSEYFPNFNGVVGKGFYINDDLRHLTVEINMQFYGKAEVIGFTQYLVGLIVSHFPQIATEVKIMSVHGQEALIVKEPDNKEPFVHIY